MKDKTYWHSERLQHATQLVRWGHFGTPLLLFPTAGGDAEECERCHVIDALFPHIRDGRLKVYSVDSFAGRSWLTGQHSPQHRAHIQNLFDAYVYGEVVPAIRMDCRNDEIQVVTAGASMGAFNALASICRHPDVFAGAICMSGTYNLERWMDGCWTEDLYFSSPLQFLPNLDDGPQLNALRQRFVVLPVGGGRWEDPGQSQYMGHVLGSKGIPNRVDVWEPQWDHDWPTWREMLPKYVDEILNRLD